MALLDGDLAQIFYGAFGGIFLDATLHRHTLTEDGAGGGSATWADEPVKASLDKASEAMRASEGYTDTDHSIIVLAHGVVRPDSDDEITLKGRRWQIASVTEDPAAAAWVLHGRLAG